MKARIKKTGEIIEVTRNSCGLYVDENRVGYNLKDLDFGNEEGDYWQDVRERAAIAAMQGIISNNRYNGSTDMVAETAVRYANALIEELKKK